MELLYFNMELEAEVLEAAACGAEYTDFESETLASLDNQLASTDALSINSMDDKLSYSFLDSANGRGCCHWAFLFPKLVSM